jgi:hypothetical protein
MKTENMIAALGLVAILGVGGFAYAQNTFEPARCKTQTALLNLGKSAIDLRLANGASVSDNIERQRKTLNVMNEMGCRFDYVAEYASLAVLAANNR